MFLRRTSACALAFALLLGMCACGGRYRSKSFGSLDELKSEPVTTFLRPALPAEPFAVKVKTGEILHLGMSRDEAEAVAGAPVEEGIVNQWVYEGVILAYRDNTLVYILIDDERWNANGAVQLGMPTEAAVEKLGMTFEEGSIAYSQAYFAGGGKEQLYPGQEPVSGKDYTSVLTLYVNGAVKGIIMADKQYALTLK